MNAITKLYSEEVLMTETDEALKSLYRQTLGSDPHHKMGKQRMVIEILGAQELIKQQEQPKPQSVAVKSKVNTQAEILDALQPQMARGLKVSFDEYGWTIRNGAAMDSGSMTVPLTLMQEIANGLLRARFPAKIKINGEEMLG